MTAVNRLRVGVHRWTPVMSSVFLTVIVTPYIITGFIDGPSWWHWVLLALLAFVVMGFPAELARTWRHRHEPPDPGPLISTLTMSEVDDAVVDAVIAQTSGRVPAVKALREKYPGLGLADAARIVDRHQS